MVKWLFLCIGSIAFGAPPFEASVRREPPLVQAFQYSYEHNNFERAKRQHRAIPKIIHHIWLGGDLPDAYKDLVASWKRLHPTWQHIFWGDAESESFPFINRAAFDTAENPAMKADIWRYEILHRYGGLYVDTDFEALMPLDDIHKSHEFYVGCHPDGAVNNALTGSVPYHPLLQACIDSIGKLDMGEVQTPLDIQNTTGPLLLTREVAKSIVKGERHIAVYPPPFFYPLGAASFAKRGVGTPDERSGVLQEVRGNVTRAVHYFAQSWVDARQRSVDSESIQGGEGVDKADLHRHIDENDSERHVVNSATSEQRCLE